MANWHGNRLLPLPCMVLLLWHSGQDCSSKCLALILSRAEARKRHTIKKNTEGNAVLFLMGRPRALQVRTPHVFAGFLQFTHLGLSNQVYQWLTLHAGNCTSLDLRPGRPKERLLGLPAHVRQRSLLGVLHLPAPRRRISPASSAVMQYCLQIHGQRQK